MEEKKLSGRQFGILTFIMMMAPVVHAVPARIIDARRGAWLAPLPAMIPLAPLLFFFFCGLSRMPEESGLGDLYHLAFGNRWGKVLYAVSALWILTIMVVDLRFYAERYISAVYPETGKLVFYLVMELLQIWIVKGSLSGLMRAGKFLFWVVIITLAAVLILVAVKVSWDNMWPATDSSWKEMGLGALRLSTTISMVVPAGFLIGKVQWKPRKGGSGWWLTGLTLVMIAITGGILGVFGLELAQRVQTLFFTLAKQVSVAGAAERLESVITAMWMMSIPP